jgi:hypothetical protein
MTFCSITFPSSAVEAWSSSEGAVTSTVSVISPTVRVTFRATVSLTPTVKSASCALLKPAISTVSP